MNYHNGTVLVFPDSLNVGELVKKNAIMKEMIHKLELDHCSSVHKTLKTAAIHIRREIKSRESHEP